MKSKTRRRVIALVLCMVMLLSCGVTTLAEGNTAEPAVTGETAAQENVSAEAQADTAADDAAVVSESQEKMAAAETAETETEGTASSDIAVQSETADTEGTERAQTEESTAADTTEQTAGTESGDAAVQSEEETTAGNDTAETSEPETSTENETQTNTAEKTGKAAQPYSEKYEDDTIKISVSAEAGIVPEGAKLSVTPIEKTEITDDMTAEEKAEAEKINDQYDLTEKKLNEDSEENEETMEGFLAYDISFLVNGEEVEPSGDVNVVMEFKEAAIPEGVSEDAAVTVKHLKEDETAEDGVVVEDMADKAEVKATEKAEVEKVELTANSFSTFTIYWGNSDRNSVTVHYVNQNGVEITTETKNERFDLGEWADLSDYAVDIENYTYQGAHLNSYNGTEVKEIRCSSQDGWRVSWSYRNSSWGQGDRWYASDSRDVYLVYKYTGEIKVHFVSGADGHDLMDSMSLEQFFADYGDGVTADLAPQIENYRFVKTMIAGVYNQYEGTYDDNTYWALRLREINGNYQYNRARMDTASENEWLDIDNQVYFIYKPDTYKIETRNSSNDGITLNLFNYDNSIKSDADSAGFPFYNGKANHVDGNTGSSNTGGDVKSTLGSDGYPQSANGNSLDFLFGENAMPTNYLFSYDAASYSYEYDSQRNHAYYDEEDERFYVYNYTLSPADTSDSHYADFEVGNFFPFNDTINPQEGQLNYIQYGREQRTNVDYWFGMSMNMNFYQPENGKLPNGDAMRFEFRGDDDVFVYLDGVLILDLGGIHAAQSGTIDFSTGTIEENGETIADGIYQRYRESRLFTQTELENMFVEIEVNGERRHIFADYQNVDMDFFYLERGAGASNCHIKFNMPPIPDDTIIVGKQITDANASVYSDVEFSFKLETKAEGESEYTTVCNKTVDVYNSIGTYIGKRDVNAEGIFILKHGERAYFTGYPVTTQYRVTEIGVSSDEYDEITIAGVTVSQIDEGGDTTERKDWRTDDLTVAKTPMVIFRNRIAATNQRQLNITKRINDDVGDATYQIQVYLGTEAAVESGTPYTGSYWINGQEYHATGGIITLKKDETASITNIPSGTSFKVVEVNLDSNTYINPVYSVENADNIGTEEAATGKLVLNADSQVTVTNALQGSPDTPYIEVQKTFEGLDKTELPSAFEIKLYKDPERNNLVATLRLDDSNVSVSEDELTYVWKLENLEAGTYYLQESGEGVENHTVTITVNGEVVTSGSVIDVTTQNARYTFKDDGVIETCSSTQLLNSNTNIIAGSFTDDTFFVWTEDTLSAGERQAIVDQISTQKGTFNKITVDNTDFFSTYEKIEEGINYRGTVSISKNGDETSLNFTAPKQWRMVYYGTYTKSEAVNAEIEVINSYTENSTPIDLVKYGSSYEGDKLSGAEFSLYKGTMGDQEIDWDPTPLEDYGNIHVTSDGEPELNIPAGYYKLKETKAPAGYQLLNEEIYFKVENGNVSLIDGITGGVLEDQNAPDLWKVSIENETITIKIKNNALYELPEAGGSGIYWYMLGGVLLMMAGSLLVYKKRRGEVLRRK